MHEFDRWMSRWDFRPRLSVPSGFLLCLAAGVLSFGATTFVLFQIDRYKMELVARAPPIRSNELMTGVEKDEARKVVVQWIKVMPR